MSAPLKLSDCITNFTAERHPGDPTRLLNITGSLKHPVFGELATIRALQISGRAHFHAQEDFLQILGADTKEVGDFSMALFDVQGKVLPWLCNRRSDARGSGCWGTELNVGFVLYIKDFQVKDEFRKRGLGSMLLRKLLDSHYVGKGGHAFCRPNATQESQNAANFVRKNGFRRVGLTPFFAYSSDPTHASRKLALASDPDPDAGFDKYSFANNLDKDSIATEQKKFGCTCGECTKGWLSPRMRFRLSTQASLHRDAIGQDLYLFKESRTLSASTDFLDAAFDYLPPSLTRQICVTFYLAVYALFDAVYQILEKKNQENNIPLPADVLSLARAENPKAVELFLAKGGKVEHVLDCVVDTAREESPLGDGSFDELFCGEEFDEMVDGPEAAVNWDGPKFDELKECKNDLQFGTVRRMLVIADGNWGPYINV